MSYNFNNSNILSKASTILGTTVDEQSMNGIANALHSRFLKVNSKSSYTNKVDYADAVLDYNNVLLSQNSQAAQRFDNLIQDTSVKTFLHDYYQTRY